jgi:hypothetical protein
LELWHEQDIQLTWTHIDIELETVFCDRHRDETMHVQYERKKRQNMDVSAQGRPAPAHEAFAV